MRHWDNLLDLSTGVNPDFFGFIFYSKSPRYFQDQERKIPNEIPPEKRVGVFVNEKLNIIKSISLKFDIKIIQLHGSESPEYCQKLIDEGFTIIKAFGIKTTQDLEPIKSYTAHCHYFLLDTKTKTHGGSGEKFDWQILDQLPGTKPFFLSGGIDVNDIKEIKNLQKEAFAIDINSRFEIKPGLKDISKISTFKSTF
jgi:phosphoribosylanthranilate isomerase